MPDQTVTDDDRRKAHEWARMAADNNHDPHNAPWRVAARLLLDHVPAPPATLADELRVMLEKRDAGEVTSFAGLLARVEAVEKENRATLNHAYDERDEALVERDEARAEAKTWREQDENYREFRGKFRTVQQERDEARAEVERLKRDLAEAYKTRDARDDEVDRLRAERDEALDKATLWEGEYEELRESEQSLRRDLADVDAEVERLTAERDGAREEIAWLRNGPGHTEVATDLPDPADVPVNTFWLIEFEGKHYEARRIPWSFREHHWSFMRDGAPCSAKDAEVTLVSRLVPGVTA